MSEGTGGAPAWVTGKLPHGVEQLDTSECKVVENLLNSRVAAINTPPVSQSHDARRVIYRPGAGYLVLTVPNGVLCFTEDHPELNRAFEDKVNTLARNGLVAWALGDIKSGCFRGRFDRDFREWLKMEFILSPLALVSPNAELIMIFNEQMRFGVVGVKQNVAASFLQALGGIERVRSTMNVYIEGYGVGFGDDDRMWARRYLMD